MSTVEIRRYRAEDAARIPAFTDAAAALDDQLRPVGREAWDAFVAAPRNRGGADFAVALEAGVLVGLATVSRELDARHVRIIVAPTHRRRGIARRLLAHVPDDAAIECTVPDGWETARAICTRDGFREVRRELTMQRALDRRMSISRAEGYISRAARADGIDDAELARVSNAGYADAAGYAIVDASTYAARRAVPGTAWHVAAHADKLAAYVHVLREDDEVGCVESIVVDPAHRRRGLGAHLLAHGLEALREAGCTAAILYVDADNAAAIALYERFGFATTGFTSTFRKDKEPR